ncbi:MAG: UDP-N-acetylmuramate dehydrogenase [Acidimicrobiales bacterium]
MTIETLIERGGPRVEQHAAFGERTTYRVGGKVRLLVTLSNARDLNELGPLFAGCGLLVVVLGNGSNLLVADGDVAALGVHLTGEFSGLTWHDEGGAVIVSAGAALDLPIAARRLAGEGVVGFEWAVGVPGTFGGAVAMNAGGHGSDMASSVVDATVWRDGALHRVSGHDLGFGYRQSALRPGDVVTEVSLRLERGDAKAAKQRISEIVRWRRENQPGGANAGSVFQNPPHASAGQLIEQAGCKGLRIGSATVSEKHANFFLVDAGGRASDVIALLDEVKKRVFESSGVTLRSEHRLIGFEQRP